MALVFFNMSNLSVLPKMMKLRSINKFVNANIRHLANSTNSGRKQLNLIEKQNNTTVFNRNCCENNISGQHNCRLVHTYRPLRKNTEDESAKKINIDQFRAEEEKIEREYEEQQKQKHEDQSSTSSTEDQEKIQKLRSDILDAALQFVPKHGWSLDAIVQGAESINYPGVAHGIFPNGGIELIHHFYAKCNRELIAKLRQEFSESTEKSENQTKIVEQPSPKDFAIKAIRLRLEMIIPYKETWPQALATMTLPQNVPKSLAQLLTLVDDICYCAGDRHVDMGWYTRRIGIASIYKMVEVYLLQDKSPGHQQTWEFLERRMDEGIQIQEFLSSSDQKTQTIAKALGSAFQTARNILGVNCDKR